MARKSVLTSSYAPILARKSARVIAANGMDDAAVVVENVGEVARLALLTELVIVEEDSFLVRLVCGNIVLLIARPGMGGIEIIVESQHDVLDTTDMVA